MTVIFFMKVSELESQLLQEQQQQSLILELERCKKTNQVSVFGEVILLVVTIYTYLEVF